EYSAVLTDILRRGVEGGAFHPLDAELTGLQVFGMCNYAWTWYRPGGRLAPEEIASAFAQNIVAGVAIRPREGKQFAPERLQRLVVSAIEHGTVALP
ncbi:MAG: hypothetical protein JWL77_6917, partial [Chthonomonadaceae bacterium]|nr:hypothetical protein [Chthonomonadaceae bacterium]